MKKLFWNEDERRLRAFWRLLLQTVLLVGLVLAFGAALAWVPGSMAKVLLMTLVGLTLSVWLAARFLDRRAFADLGFRLSRAWWLDFGFGLLLGAFLMAGVFLAEQALGWVRVTGTFEGGGAQPFGLALLAPLLGFVTVGFYEELLSRGYQFKNIAEGFNLGRLGPRGGIVVAWVLTSVVFGLGHALNPNASFISTFNIVLAGLFIVLGYVLTAELALPIGLHITWNFFQGPVFGFPVSGTRNWDAQVLLTEQSGPALWTGGAFGPEAGLVGLIAMLAGSLLILGWVRWRYGALRLQTSIAEPPVVSPAPADHAEGTSNERGVRPSM